MNKYRITNPNNNIVRDCKSRTTDFSWDVKGNMIRHRSDLNSWKERFLCWTEDNRLQAVKDNKMGAYYNYDAAGERNLKLTGGIINVTQNGQSVYAPVFDQQTLYASALVTVNDKGYTKHYFEEGKRICSKIGSGGLKNVFDPVPKIEKSYEEQRDIQVEGIHTTYRQCMDISPYIKNGNLYETIIKKYTTQVNSSEPAFYYHSDHLGSASYITGSSGIQTQQLVYLPFGEDWVDKKYNVSQFQTPYKFNGKEKDPETGYNNYGARYYTDKLSIFLSVDPMSDKYPHLTSYNYCANNPVMLIDPDGREILYSGAEEEKVYQDYRNKVFSDDKKYGHIQKELLRLEKSEEKFRIRMGKNISNDAEGGNFIYNSSTKEFDVNIGQNSDFSQEEKLAHELKHADQYMDGKIAFIVKGNKVDTYFNSEQNERDAYNRQIEIGSDKVNSHFLDKHFGNYNNKQNFNASDVQERGFMDWQKEGNSQQTNDALKKIGQPYFIHKSLKTK